MLSFLERTLLLPSALLVLSVSHALGQMLESRQAESGALPAPLSITPDENWDGIDGSWSSFTLRVGTPQQFVRTFVSFKAYQTWVVLPQGCDAASDEQSCADARGNLFNESASSSFDKIGIFDLWIEDNLGLDGNAIYGYDVVGLGGEGENGPTLKNTTVGGFAVEDFYLGILGINPKPTNFTSFNDPSPSYMTLLKENGSIASVSAGYTAGAQYQYEGGVLASLTLGGYDASRFVENDVEFIFGVDNERDIVLAIQSISTSSQTNSSPIATELLPSPIYAYIDSTVPQIWLPIEACELFEDEFGIEYNNATNLYLVNDTLHQNLTQRNPNVTFSLGQDLTGGATVQITLPYAAFDLTAQPPYQGLPNQSYYFPLRRAENDTQYTLGRTFLQEAYLTVDWEAQRFNVSQVAWSQNYQENLVLIPPTSANSTSSTSSSSTSSSSRGGIGGGAIAGIVIGAVAVIALIAGLVFWLLRRRRQARKAAENEKLGEPEHPRGGGDVNVFPKAELPGSAPFVPKEVDSDSNRLLSPHDSSHPGTPSTSNPASTPGFFGPGSNSAYSPSTPTPGEGTYSSTQSGSNATSNGASNGTSNSVVSPMTPCEADSKNLAIYEMPGDMPTIKEKDGRALSEKEVLQHRERIYNGVDSAPNSAIAVNEVSTPREPPRRVNPEDIVRADRLPPHDHQDQMYHRAFSFEEERSSDELYE